MWDYLLSWILSRGVASRCVSGGVLRYCGVCARKGLLEGLVCESNILRHSMPQYVSLPFCTRLCVHLVN